MRHIETIIVGGGPSGSAAAKELVDAGRDVVILDRKEFPRLKLCGGWITPEAMQRIGFTAEEYPHRINKFERMYIHHGNLNYSVGVVQWSISRTEFDKWLLDRSGAEVILENVKTIEERDGKYIINEKYSCDYLLGAGGTACPVARNFFQRNDKERRQVITRELEYDTKVLTDDCHLFWHRKLTGYGWYVPKQNGRINIGVGGLKLKVKDIDVWWQWVEKQCFAYNLITEPIGRPKAHAYYVNGKNPTPRRGNIFLIGDALGLATIDLAEGIDPAVHSGQMAAHSVLTGAEYRPEQIKKYSLPMGRLLRYMPYMPAIKA